MSASEHGEDQGPHISGPLVFSCVKCRTIVGDSFSFLSSSAETKTITLSAASNIQRSTELYTSYETLDEGSTYFGLICPECQNSLGRFYVTTSTDLDHVRDRFTFNIEAISSYELGKSQHGKIPEPVVLSYPAAEETTVDNVSHVEAVQEDVTKIQHVLVDLVQRVGELERVLLQLTRGGAEGAPSAAGRGSGHKRSRGQA